VAAWAVCALDTILLLSKNIFTAKEAENSYQRWSFYFSMTVQRLLNRALSLILKNFIIAIQIIKSTPLERCRYHYLLNLALNLGLIIINAAFNKLCMHATCTAYEISGTVFVCKSLPPKHLLQNTYFKDSFCPR
jgi:hypothetical protein